MQNWREIGALVRKEVVLEWRQRYALNGMLLYVVSTVFVVYLSFNLRGATLDPIVWNALFWVILLFTALNAIAKSFAQERAGRLLYYYTLVSPLRLIVAKMIYNAGLMVLLTALAFAAFALVLGNPVQDGLLFAVSLLLGACGFSGTLTMVAGIAAKAPQNSTLMAILSFPVILPLLLMLLRLSKNAIDGLDRSVSADEVLTLLALNVIVVTVSCLLFPYLWRS